MDVVLPPDLRRTGLFGKFERGTEVLYTQWDLQTHLAGNPSDPLVVRRPLGILPVRAAAGAES